MKMKICYESFQMLHNKLAELLGKNFRCCCFWELMTYSIVLMAQVQSINFILIYHHRNYWLRQKAIQEKSFFWQNPIWGKICHHLRNLDYCIFTTREIDFILIWCLLWHNLVGKIRNDFGTFFTYFPHIEKNLRKVNWSFLLKYFNWFEYYFWYFKPNKDKKSEKPFINVSKNAKYQIASSSFSTDEL